ncbi:hypothetical protein KIN20_003816 [Parelaphostrongylus tenuis]|uniref:Uncharacterized protein n=1 Tax=Parelaphostrongylus tenuis TaxID=148309 RepID=A0AAD5M0T4_PARTN|nr:hypothetical protein KIN20_003816 [Parelaphostrongylus tenuis]
MNEILDEVVVDFTNLKGYWQHHGCLLNKNVQTISKNFWVDQYFRHVELSREMWQRIVNRAVRILASGPFGSHLFFGIWNRQLKRDLN